MTKEQLNEFVKKLEPLFIGYTADESSLKNSNGMELYFCMDWKNKTTVRGLHAKHRHSIGCSFDKPPEKIFKDIRRRLMPDYHTDFFKHKRETQERQEHKAAKDEMLRAIASVIGGEISKNYDYHYSGNSNFVHAENVSIYEHYMAGYELRIKIDYMATMKLAEYLKSSGFIDEKTKEEDD